MDTKTVSLRGFLDELKVDKVAADHVVRLLENERLADTKFRFDAQEFKRSCNFLMRFLDTGAVAIAPADQFDALWTTEYLAAEGKYEYSTKGNPAGEKLRHRI